MREEQSHNNTIFEAVESIPRPDEFFAVLSSTSEYRFGGVEEYKRYKGSYENGQIPREFVEALEIALDAWIESSREEYYGSIS